MAALSARRRRGRLGSLLPGRRRLSAACAGDSGPSDPALGIPDELHALSAGDFAGHVAGSVRVPEPGRGPDRHGSRQRLDVRRLDGLRRSDADGPPADAATEGSAFGRPAPPICRRRRDPRARWRAIRSSAFRPTSGRRRTSFRLSTTRRVASSCRRPDFFGNPRDLKPIADAAHARGRAADRRLHGSGLAGAVRLARRDGRRHRVGEGQWIGNALNFGGPYVGLFATRLKYLRQMPGRLAGETVDAEGRRSFVLTLSTREQHIRREKATSNICTNSGLCALAFSIHLTLLGGTGLKRLANVNHANAVRSRGDARRRSGRRDSRTAISSTNSRSAHAASRCGAYRRPGGEGRHRRPAGLASPAGRRTRRLHRRGQHRDQQRRRPCGLWPGACRLPPILKTGPVYEQRRPTDAPRSRRGRVA